MGQTQVIIPSETLPHNSKAFSRESDDWPRHRGDSALQGNSGQKIGTSLKLDWVFDAGDFLESSVVVSEGIAYVGADTGILHALDVKTGKEKWQYKTGLSIEAPPLVHAGMVYVGSTAAAQSARVRRATLVQSTHRRFGPRA